MTTSNDTQPWTDLGEAILNGILSDDFLKMLVRRLRAERRKQIAKWGGVAHDDTLSVQTWREIIVRSLDNTFEVMEKVNLTEGDHWKITYGGIIETLTLLVALLQSRTRLVAKEFTKSMPLLGDGDDDMGTWEDYVARGCPVFMSDA